MADAAHGDGEESLEARVVSWLDSQGYPLEMRVAREFRRAGATVEVGRFYTDPETQEPREIDVVATFGETRPSSPGRMSVAITLACECKANSEPWVMFTRPAMASELPLSARVFHSRWGTVIQKAAPWVPTRDVIDVTGEAAYSGVRAFKAGAAVDPVYKAIQSATKAAYSLAVETQQSIPTLVHVVFPVIVIDATVFSCSLADDREELDVKRINTGVPLRWARPIGGRSLTVVDVVVARELPRYVSATRSMAHELTEHIERSATR